MKTHRTLLLVALTLLGICMASCSGGGSTGSVLGIGGGGDGGGSGGGSGGGGGDGSILLAAADIGFEGGILATSDNAVRISIPKGALGPPVGMTISRVPSSQTGMGTGIGNMYDIGPSGTNFNYPVEITVAYQSSQLPALTDEQSLRLFFNDGDSWVGIPDCSVDNTAKTVTCIVRHLTRFALLMPADMTPPDPPQNVTVTEQSGVAVISWTNPTFDYHHTRIYRGTSDTFPINHINGSLHFDNVTAGIKRDESVIPGQTYYYTVRSVDGSGNESTNLDKISIKMSKSPYLQSDLVGTWDLYQFKTSTQAGGAGWFRLVVRFDGNGHMIVDDNATWETTNNDDTAPPNGDTGLVWTVNSAGTITADTSDPPDTTFHGNIASNKQFIVATTTLSPTDRAIQILRKRVPGVTYSNADLSEKTFAFHILSAGNAPKWERGDGFINNNGSVTLANLFDSGGNHSTNGSGGRFSINPAGVVTNPSDADFKGFLTPDKRILIGTGTNPLGSAGTNYDLMILTISGQTFTQADFAGTWNMHQINCGTESEWGYGTVTAGASGNVTYTPLGTSRTGPLTPWSGTLSLSPSGILTEGSPTTFQGVMSYNKDFVFFTDTGETGNVYDLSILMK